LADLVIQARNLIAFAEAEQAGTFDGVGQNNWIGGRDPVLATARKVAQLCERISGERKDWLIARR